MILWSIASSCGKSVAFGLCAVLHKVKNGNTFDCPCSGRGLRGENCCMLSPLADGPAAGVLRRQRGVPLPRAGVRGAAVRAGGAARCRVAADHERGGRVRGLAPAVAFAASGRRIDGAAGGGARGRARGDEQLLLRGDRAPSARHRVRDRVPAGDRARGDGRALAAQRRRARAGGGRCVRARRRRAERRAARGGVCVRQRGAVRAVHRARAPRVARAGDRRHRRAGRRDADRGAGEHRDRRLGGGPALCSTRSRSAPGSASGSPHR